MGTEIFMSRSRKQSTTEKAPPPGAALSSVTTIPAPSHVDGVSLDVLRWASRERGVTMTVLYSALKADPSLIPGIVASAKGQNVSQPKAQQTKGQTPADSSSTTAATDGTTDSMLIGAP